MIDTETKTNLKESIRRHLAAHGSVQWNIVREQFSQIPAATFWRYVAKEKARPAQKDQIDDAKAKIAVALSTASDDARRTAAVAVMPCLPSPAYIAKSGSEGLRHLDLLARLSGMLGDVDRVRSYAMNNAGEITDAELFSSSIEVGIKVIGAAIKSIDSVYDQRRMVGFYDTIVDVIAEESPETAGRIIARLQKLDKERGYSFGSGVDNLSHITAA